MIDAIACRFQTGAQWVHLPERYGNWRGVYNRLRMWALDGAWERVFTALVAQADADEDLTWAVSVDSTVVRAHQHAAGEPADHAIGRSRGGVTTKIHLAADAQCRPLAFVLTAGQAGDAPAFDAVDGPAQGRTWSWLTAVARRRIRLHERPRRSPPTYVTPPPRKRGGFSLDRAGSHDGQALTAAEAGSQRNTPLRGSGSQNAFPARPQGQDSHARSGMAPSNLDFLDRLPVMPSGKVHRTRLPAPVSRQLVGTGRVVPTRGELETRGCVTPGRRHAASLPASCRRRPISSPTSAVTPCSPRAPCRCCVAGATGPVSRLRDVYENPTVRALAPRLRSSAGSPGMVEQPRTAPLRHGGGRIARAGMAQAAALYGLLLSLTGPVAVSYAVNHARLSGWGAVGTTIAVLAGYAAVRWIVPVALARPLAAGIRPGRYPPWAATYLRLWALDMLVLSMSPLP